MADVIRTIGSTTGDETTVGDAITWMQNSANYDRSTDDVGILRIVDAEAFNETWTLGSFTGTATSSKYVLLEAAHEVRHQGKLDANRAICKRTSTGDATPHELDEDYLHVRYMQFDMTAAEASSSTVAVLNNGSTPYTDIVVEKCILSAQNTNQLNAFTSGNAGGNPVTLYDCVVMGHGAGGTSSVLVNYRHELATTAVYNHFFLTVIESGRDGIGGSANSTPTSSTVNIYNCVSLDSVRDDYITDQTDQSLNAGGCLASDGTTTTDLTGSGNVDNVSLVDVDQSGSIHLVAETAAGSQDFQIVSATTGTNEAVDNAQTGGTIDSRIDQTLDVAGNARPSTYTERDSGAFELAQPPIARRLRENRRWAYLRM